MLWSRGVAELVEFNSSAKVNSSAQLNWFMCHASAGNHKVFSFVTYMICYILLDVNNGGCLRSFFALDILFYFVDLFSG